MPDHDSAKPDLSSTPVRPRSRWKRWLIRLVKFSALCFALVLVVTLIWLRRGIYHHFITFPREQAAWVALRAQSQPVKETGGWTEYRGILHSHSKFSHDSEVPFETILKAMQIDRLDFICMSDHTIDGLGNFDWQWRGLHDGKLFIPGFEMKEGMMPFGVRSGVVVRMDTPSPELAKQIATNGGVLFYAHSEEPRAWEEPNLTGMEIYNIHSDVLRFPGGLRGMLPDVILNMGSYPEQTMRTLFHRPTDFLKHWDELNRTRHLTGISGNDCHQNCGIRAFSTATNTIRLEDTSPRKLWEPKLNWFTRPFARILFGPLTPGRKLFHFQLDPYERSAHFVNTHILARELSEPAVLDALRVSRVFVAFDMIADSSGFRWLASGTDAQTVMGESTPWSKELRLRAFSPIPGRFTVVKDGNQVHQAQGRTLEWTPPGPGKYRVEVELDIRGEWVPWIYANPIELR